MLSYKYNAILTLNKYSTVFVSDLWIRFKILLTLNSSLIIGLIYAVFMYVHIFGKWILRVNQDLLYVTKVTRQASTCLIWILKIRNLLFSLNFELNNFHFIMFGLAFVRLVLCRSDTVNEVNYLGKAITNDWSVMPEIVNQISQISFVCVAFLKTGSSMKFTDAVVCKNECYLSGCLPMGA